MSALDKLNEIDLKVITPLQAAVVYLSGKHQGDAARAAEELAALRAELARKTQILKELEYIEYPDDIEVRLDYYMKFKFCPVCGYKEPDGHWKDCELGTACEDLK